MTRTSLRTIASLFLLVVLFAAQSAEAVSPSPVIPTDECVEVDHFPDEPIGTSPSKAILYFTVPNEFGGWDVEVVVDGASGLVEDVAIIEEDGLGVVQIPLNAYGAHQVQEAVMSLGGELVDIELLPEGFTVDAAEPTCDPAALTRAEPTSVATTSTTALATATTGSTTSTAVVSTTTAATTTTLADVSGDAGSIPWGWIGIGLGLPLVLFGVWLLAGAGRNCEPLRREWQRLQQQYDSIREAFDAAVAYLEEKRAARSVVQAEVAEIERVGRMGGILEGDLRFKNIPAGRVTEAGYDQILGTARERLDSASETERSAEESVDNWRLQLEEAAAKADAARRAYEECIGKAVAGLTPPADSSPANGQSATGQSATGQSATGQSGTGQSGTGQSGTGQSGTGQSGTGQSAHGGPVTVAATPDVSGCPEGTRESRSLTAPRSFRVYVDFAVIVEVEEGTERNIQTGEDLAINLGQLGLDLGAIGSLQEHEGRE